MAGAIQIKQAGAGGSGSAGALQMQLFFTIAWYWRVGILSIFLSITELQILRTNTDIFFSLFYICNSASDSGRFRSRAGSAGRSRDGGRNTNAAGFFFFCSAWYQMVCILNVFVSVIDPNGKY